MKKKFVKSMGFFVLLVLLGNSSLVAKRKSLSNSYVNYVERPYRSRVEKKAIQTQDIYLGSVFFAYGSSTLRPSSVKRLAKIANNYLLDFQPENADQQLRIKIIGFADKDGSSNYNLALGMRRAETTAQVLERLHIPMQDAKVASTGSSKSYAKAAKYRRAEIWLVPFSHQSNELAFYILIFFMIMVILGVGFYLVFTNQNRRPF